MKEEIQHFTIEEPIYEYFVTVCSWCKKELPDELDVWYGHTPQLGDVCPYCGKPLVEEVENAS